MSEARKWKIIEHSWRNTSIENEDGRIVCELDLESFDDLNENNQDKYEQLQRADAELIASAPALRDERDRLRAALLRDHNLRRCDVLDSKYKKGLAAVKVLQSQLSQLQALVRALPVEQGPFLVQEADGDYYVDGNVRFCCSKDAHAYADLLRYRATLDATTPAVCPRIGGCLKEQGFHCCCEEGTCD